jgi:P-type Cu+ transporter
MSAMLLCVCLSRRAPLVGASADADSAAQCFLLSIEGMACKECATHAQKALAKVPGVAKASVSFEKSEADVCTGAGTQVRVEDLLKAVEKAGYKAKVKRKSQG